MLPGNTDLMSDCVTSLTPGGWRWLRGLALALLVSGPCVGRSGESGSVPTPGGSPATGGHMKAPPPDLSWVPPADGFDWVQLKSGEWLKGWIKALQDRELEFDSEELDDLKFDWKNIRQMRSQRTIDVLFANGEKVSGPIMITPDQISVGGRRPRPR